jgi:hypothetical protein
MNRETSTKTPRRMRRMPDKLFGRVVSKIKQRATKLPSQETMAVIDEAVRAVRNKRDRK